jgi:protein tyrosine/serine phosphatase
MKFFRLKLRASLWSIVFLLICCSTIVAQNADINKKDLPNFYRIDDHYLHGGQPNEAGFHKLAEMGVKLVIDLRGDGGDRDEREEQTVTALGMRYINIPISSWHAPEEKQIEQFLALLRESENLPVFVHCMLGKDRTGEATAIYRIEFYHWSGEQAFDEMKQRGFTLPFLRRGMKSYVLKYGERKMHAGEEHAAAAGQGDQTPATVNH